MRKTNKAPNGGGDATAKIRTLLLRAAPQFHQPRIAVVIYHSLNHTIRQNNETRLQSYNTNYTTSHSYHISEN
ncbi:hypothetical protein Trydic_g12455 [Trypoxylus dichotomus]